MKLIVGLGNPGKNYENTRHNMGFMALNEIAKTLNVTFSKEKFNGLYVSTTYKNEKIILLKPQCYMNLSGEVISKFMSFYKIRIDDFLVIHDDLDLPVGSFKIKPGGSPGGHNGLKNIESHLHTKQYKRIKIGVSNDKNRDTKEYVLEKIGKKDMDLLQNVLEKMPMIFEDYMSLSYDLLMNKYNRK